MTVAALKLWSYLCCRCLNKDRMTIYLECFSSGILLVLSWFPSSFLILPFLTSSHLLILFRKFILQKCLLFSDTLSKIVHALLILIKETIEIMLHSSSHFIFSPCFTFKSYILQKYSSAFYLTEYTVLLKEILDAYEFLLQEHLLIMIFCAWIEVIDT